MRRIYLALVSILYISTTAIAQETAPLPLSLQDCMDYAMKHNYTVKNAQLDVLIQKAQTGQTLSAALPHINGKADFTYYPVAQSSFIDAHALDPAVPAGYIEAFPFSLSYAGDASITASQTLFDGQVLVAIKAKNTLLEFAKLNGAVTEESVRYNVERSYNSLVIAYRQFEIIKSSLNYARSLEHDITVTQQNGLAEKIEVERTSVQVNNLATDSIKISNALTVSEQMLKYQIGMDLNTPIILTDTSVEARSQKVIALLNENEDYERVPEYNVAVTALKLQEYNLQRYKFAGYPTLSAFFMQGSNYGSEKLTDLFFLNRYYAFSTFGITLNAPIFNGFMRKYQVEEARVNVEKSKNNILYQKQTIDYQAANARTTLKNAVLQTQSQHRNLDLANDVLDLAQRKYKAGVGSNVEVTQAQTDQLNAQTNYFNALLDLINAEADLKKALGLLK